MRTLDHAFGVTLFAFSLGALLGALLVASSTFLQGYMIALIQYRVVEPVTNASAIGAGFVALVVFLNNSVPVVLSFLFPTIVGKVSWTPPLSQRGVKLLMLSFSVLTGFLLGFLDLGAVLSLGWVLGGIRLLTSLLAVSWLHGPIEFYFVLLAVSEPFRLVGDGKKGLELVQGIKKDLRLLLVCLIGLLLSSLLEIFFRV